MELMEIEKFIKDKLASFADENDIEINQLEKDTRLIGVNGLFDSMDLVRFIVDLEEALEDEFSLEVSLANEKAMSRSSSPFINISTLSKYIKELVDE
jgi:acyl carrier protein